MSSLCTSNASTLKFFIVALVVLCSCSGSSVRLTPQQEHLKTIRRSYGKAKRNAKDNLKEKERLGIEYQKSLERFLKDTCQNVLDSVNVKVTTIRSEDSIISVAFTDEWFIYYALAIKRAGIQDSLYNHYQTLKVGEKVALRMVYLGESDIKGTNTMGYPTIKVAALPVGAALHREHLQELREIY
jgi:hypothetical protein